ncbi:MAG: hypothetical protein NTW19_12145 [Planctomycetota bacterium]|nr:hypothetical protein [Planctomycetota bacterium]
MTTPIEQRSQCPNCGIAVGTHSVALIGTGRYYVFTCPRCIESVGDERLSLLFFTDEGGRRFKLGAAAKPIPLRA